MKTTQEQLKKTAQEFGVPMPETCKELQLKTCNSKHFLGHKEPKMAWIIYCPDYYKTNGFGVCPSEKIIGLAYYYEHKPFRFKNARTYILVDTLKKIKSGCVFESWIAPQMHELIPVLANTNRHSHSISFCGDTYDTWLEVAYSPSVTKVFDIPDNHIAECLAQEIIKLKNQ